VTTGDTFPYKITPVAPTSSASTDHRYAQVVLFLQMAVPLNILHLADLANTVFEAQRSAWLDPASAQQAGVFSEAIPAGGMPAGETGAALTHLAKIIAALAFQPGGVSIFGYHWVAWRKLPATNWEEEQAAA